MGEWGRAQIFWEALARRLDSFGRDFFGGWIHLDAIFLRLDSFGRDFFLRLDWIGRDFLGVGLDWIGRGILLF